MNSSFSNDFMMISYVCISIVINCVDGRVGRVKLVMISIV